MANIAPVLHAESASTSTVVSTGLGVAPGSTTEIIRTGAAPVGDPHIDTE